jgi:mannose-1-phosphate guanylyltransferase
MGGSGTRLWPLSRNAVPKQLLPLTSQRSMLQETLLRLNGIEHLARPVIVCNQEHRFMVAEQLRQITLIRKTSSWSQLDAIRQRPSLWLQCA